MFGNVTSTDDASTESFRSDISSELDFISKTTPTTEHNAEGLFSCGKFSDDGGGELRV